MMTPQAGEIVVQLVDSIRGKKLERFLDFCFSLSDEISLGSISKKKILKEEAKEAAKKAGEALKERGLTAEDTEEWIQDYYDRIEENSKCYVQSRQDLEALVNKNLADYELIEREVTCSTHCTLGGPTAVYHFKNEAHLRSRFKRMTTTFDWIILDEVNEFELEDPAFYKEGKLICSICSHEKLGFLYLTEEEYKVFRRLRVPHDIQYINAIKDNEVQMEPMVIENATYYPLEAEMTEGGKDEVENKQVEDVKRRKELVEHLKEYAYQEREKVVLWGWHQENVPEEIGQIKTLKELWVLDYEVKELPRALEELTDLECLRITRNQVEELNFDIFK